MVAWKKCNCNLSLLELVNEFSATTYKHKPANIKVWSIAKILKNKCTLNKLAKNSIAAMTLTIDNFFNLDKELLNRIKYSGERLS